MQFLRIKPGVNINAAMVEEFRVVTRYKWTSTKDVPDGFAVRISMPSYYSEQASYHDAGWFGTEQEAETALEECVERLATGYGFNFGQYVKPEEVVL